MTDYCPCCDVSLIGDPIPEDMREHYSPPYHWRREIGIEIHGYDGISYWRCPDCKGEWDRFTGKVTKDGSNAQDPGRYTV